MTTVLEPSTFEQERAPGSIDFWKRALAGLPPFVDVPTDYARPARRLGRARHVSSPASRSLADEVARLADTHGLQRSGVLMGALGIVLARWSGQAQFALGVASGGVASVVPVRVVVNEDGTALDALRAAAAQEALSAEHASVSLDVIAAAANIERSPAHHPLYNVTLAHAAGVPEATTNLDLAFEYQDRPEGLKLSCLYAAELFAPETVERMLAHLETTLQRIVAAPEVGLRALSTLPESERKRVVEDWNRTEAVYPEACLHELFEAQARRVPERIALSFEGATLTYAELDRWANRVARHLMSSGVGVGSRVGVSMERSHELVVALLATLKAGAAYVPLDPSYPRDRLSRLYRDAEVPVLLTSAKLAPLFEGATCKVIALDGAERPWDSEESSSPGVKTRGDDIAYGIFTSGSTGHPKAALNTHRGVVNRLQWGQLTYALGEDDRVLQKTPFGFDVSVWELFWPLMVGARLVLARPGGQRDSKYLAEIIQQEAITTVHFVPSMLELMLGEPGFADCRTLRRVLASGEALSPEVVNRYWEVQSTPLYNLYGPTEAAIEVTAWTCPRPAPERLSIGRPIANTRLYVLDDAKRPVPLGARGELYLGGVGVARGYLNRPELTRERFIPSPFVEGDVLYRTGDLVRYWTTGDVEYLGRLDDQIKLRGFRIELGEIQAALEAHESVREARVVAEHVGGATHLVAYVVGTAGGGHAPELRAALGETLPEYMVPAAFVFLDALPIGPNGKLDRRALPSPEIERAPEKTYVAPRNETESKLASIYAGVLGQKRVGIHDDFFDLGGTSILVMRLRSKINANLNVSLSLKTILEKATVAGVAEQILHGRLSEAPTDATLAPASPESPAPRPVAAPVQPKATSAAAAPRARLVVCASRAEYLRAVGACAASNPGEASPSYPVLAAGDTMRIDDLARFYGTTIETWSGNVTPSASDRDELRRLVEEVTADRRVTGEVPADIVVALDEEYGVVAAALACLEARPFLALRGLAELPRFARVLEQAKSVVLVGSPRHFDKPALEALLGHAGTAPLRAPFGVLTAHSVEAASRIVARGALCASDARRPTLSVVDIVAPVMPEGNDRIVPLHELTAEMATALLSVDHDLLAISSHGDGIDVELGGAFLCGKPSRPTRHSLPVVGTHSCLDEGDFCPKNRGGAIPRVPVDSLRSRVLFVESCSALSIHDGIAPSSLSLALGALEGLPAAYISTIKAVRATMVGPFLASAMLESGCTLGETTRTFDAVQLAVSDDLPGVVLMGDPAARLRAQRSDVVSEGNELSTRGEASLRLPERPWRFARFDFQGEAAEALARDSGVRLHAVVEGPGGPDAISFLRAIAVRETLGAPVSVLLFSPVPLEVRQVNVRLANREAARTGVVQRLSFLEKNLTQLRTLHRGMAALTGERAKPERARFAADLARAMGQAEDLMHQALAANQLEGQLVSVGRHDDPEWLSARIEGTLSELSTTVVSSWQGATMPQYQVPLYELELLANGKEVRAGACYMCSGATVDLAFLSDVRRDVQRIVTRCGRCGTLFDRPSYEPAVEVCGAKSVRRGETLVQRATLVNDSPVEKHFSVAACIRENYKWVQASFAQPVQECIVPPESTVELPFEIAIGAGTAPGTYTLVVMAMHALGWNVSLKPFGVTRGDV